MSELWLKKNHNDNGWWQLWQQQDNQETRQSVLRLQAIHQNINVAESSCTHTAHQKGMKDLPRNLPPPLICQESHFSIARHAWHAAWSQDVLLKLSCCLAQGFGWPSSSLPQHSAAAYLQTTPTWDVKWQMLVGDFATSRNALAVWLLYSFNFLL